jgi:hypothetical protein
MSATMQMVDQPIKRRSGRGFVYEAKFYYAGTDPESVMPNIGDSVSWGPGAYNRVVDQPRADPLGFSAYLIYVTASSGSDDGTITDPKTKDEFAKTVKKRMTLKELHLDAKWWGMRVADRTDAGLVAVKQFEKKGSDLSYSYYFEYPEVGDGDLLSMAVTGSYIYNNATPRMFYITTEKSKDPTEQAAQTRAGQYVGMLNEHTEPHGRDMGSCNDILSPYVGPDGNNYRLAGTPCKTFIYQVTFYTRKTFNTIGMFAGLNGAFGAGCAPFDIVANRWKAIDQTVEDVKDSDGDLWAQITRTMELAVGTWTWQPAKSVHGTWTW